MLDVENKIKIKCLVSSFLSNKARRLVLFIFVLNLCSSPLYSQFDGQFSQYMEMKASINPAAVGEQQMMEVLAAQRLQWLGIVGAPKTTLFMVNTPFTILKTSHAGGLEFVSDVYGLFANQQINVQYAYKHQFGSLTLSAGLNLGCINIIVNGDSVKMVESEYHTENDPAIPTNKQSGVGFDLGLGIYLSSDKFYVGLSALHVPASTIHLGDRYKFKLTRSYNLIGGYNFTLVNSDYQIKPSLLLVSDFVSWQAYVSCMLSYKKKFWGGLTYSIQNSVGFTYGMEIIPGLRFGYTYELPASRIIRTTSGSHELYLAYAFNIFVPKREQKHKSIRIL